MSFPVVSATNVHHPAANTAAVKTITGVAGKRIVVKNIIFGYSAAPTGGLLSMTVDGNTVLSIPITEGGAGALGFAADVAEADTGKTVVATLAAGGAGISGKLNVYWGWK